jgi:catechol 2,3-dioxygenase-like lactoylglutathione lyase family enzyme
MKIEHVAFNVADPLGMARWYVEHLGFTVKRRMMESPWAHFLADDSGTVMIEIYGNPDVPVPDYKGTHPMVLHLALVSADVAADVARLEKAGCELWGEINHQPNGDVMAIVHDPWGFPVQLLTRAEPMV